MHSYFPPCEHAGKGYVRDKIKNQISPEIICQANAKSLVKLTNQKYLWDQEIFARSHSGTIPCSIQESFKKKKQIVVKVFKI